MHAERHELRQEGRRPTAGVIRGSEGTDMRSGSDGNTGPRNSLSLRGGRAGDFMRRTWKTIPYALLVMAAFLMSGCGDSDTPNPELVSRAEHMLSEHGVTITDAKGDWIWTGNQEDNPSPYPVPWADLTGATFAVDADYLYVRLTVDGVYPRTEAELPWYGEDQVNKLNVDICLDTDNNKNTGSLADNGSEVMLGTGMFFTPDGVWVDFYDFWYGPTGVDLPETGRYEHTFNQDLVVAAWGGAGFDYRVIVFPVGPLGLRPGQTIAVNGWDECASLQYPERHATFDVLGPGGMNSRVVIQLPN